MDPEKHSELKVTATAPEASPWKNLSLQLRSTPVVIVLVSWLICTSLITILATGSGLGWGSTLMMIFIGLFLRGLAEAPSQPEKELQQPEHKPGEHDDLKH